jgi:hypothetical protein
LEDLYKLSLGQIFSTIDKNSIKTLAFCSEKISFNDREKINTDVSERILQAMNYMHLSNLTSLSVTYNNQFSFTEIKKMKQLQKINLKSKNSRVSSIYTLDNELKLMELPNLRSFELNNDNTISEIIKLDFKTKISPHLTKLCLNKCI